ncbi:MAG: hypothetical protein DRG37_05170 [Deltaproteobacteria bacterium]|nr:MAG: hypothetical protein DRG37_05170 [Deltaproteobacteria bacterium]
MTFFMPCITESTIGSILAMILAWPSSSDFQGVPPISSAMSFVSASASLDLLRLFSSALLKG